VLQAQDSQTSSSTATATNSSSVTLTGQSSEEDLFKDEESVIPAKRTKLSSSSDEVILVFSCNLVLFLWLYNLHFLTLMLAVPGSPRGDGSWE
jgi:hypothetical protein